MVQSLRQLDLHAGIKQPLVATKPAEQCIDAAENVDGYHCSPPARLDSTVRRLQATVGCMWDGNSAEENDLRFGTGKNHEPQPHG